MQCLCLCRTVTKTTNTFNYMLFVSPLNLTINSFCRSERQARLEREQEDMMKKINKIRKSDFNNTKRIERPEEILARRKQERERRNIWYRRAWRAITFQN